MTALQGAVRSVLATRTALLALISHPADTVTLSGNFVAFVVVQTVALLRAVGSVATVCADVITSWPLQTILSLVLHSLP